MTSQPTARISSKQPKQARSTELVAAILDAAAQVLRRKVRIGSPRPASPRRPVLAWVPLYQYFPNKAAILFRLQSDEWRQTTGLLRAILEDRQRPPLDRLRALVHAFIRSSAMRLRCAWR
jgi:hypothetical protein